MMFRRASNHQSDRVQVSDCQSAGWLDRRGFILVVVTVVVILLSLVAYTFTSTMQVEYTASLMHGRDVEARMMAESGIEFAAAKIAERNADPSTVDLFHDPSVFRGRIVTEADNERGQVRFSIVVPHNGAAGENLRFGMATENARFNLNRLTEFEEDDDDTTDPYDAISHVPGMTEDVVNSILDWIDSDEDIRTGGAESEYYSTLAVPYEPRNAPMESIDELLMIQGVTPQLFYGEDANRNGVLDPNENDGDSQPPNDNGDGVLDIGWRDYFTVASRERNLRADGSERINLNQGLMTELYDAIEPELGEDAAQFIVAYRLFGNANADAATQQSLTVAQKDAATAVGKAVTGGVEGSVTRGGMDLTKVAGFSFRSIYDLIDAEIQAEVNGSQTTLTSPWTSDGGSLLEDMPILEEALSWVDDAYFDGRVNINEAPREVLMAIPGMTETIADAIISSRPSLKSDGLSQSVMLNRVTPAWLLAEGVVDLETLRVLGPWLTTTGDIYRFQALGHFDQGGPNTRLEAVIDGSQTPPKLIFQRDLTSLGRGFQPWELSGEVRGR